MTWKLDKLDMEEAVSAVKRLPGVEDAGWAEDIKSKRPILYIHTERLGSVRYGSNRFQLTIEAYDHPLLAGHRSSVYHETTLLAKEPAVGRWRGVVDRWPYRPCVGSVVQWEMHRAIAEKDFAMAVCHMFAFLGLRHKKPSKKPTNPQPEVSIEIE